MKNNNSQYDMNPGLLTFTEENILAQAEQADYTLGYYPLRFYVKDGLPSETPTDETGEFYLYPSGGTVRDTNFNIILYSTKFDTHKGYRPPHLRNKS